MSMSTEHAEQLKNEVAVVCCRTEEGTIISAGNLEDPAIFPDMVDSGLLTIPDNCVKIGEVIGAKLFHEFVSRLEFPGRPRNAI